MSVILALPKLYDQVDARFQAEGVSVPMVFGWSGPAQQPTATSRIVWVPGDDESGDLGSLVPPKRPGQFERPLANLLELATVYVYAVDRMALTDERAQYQATRELFDAWYRAVFLAAAYGNVDVVSSKWVVKTTVAPHGAAIRVVIATRAVIPDVAPSITVVNSDFVDTQTLTPGPIP